MKYAVLIFLLLVLPPAATGQEGKPAPAIIDSEGISARLVRHGCGARLYHTAARITVSSRRAELVPEEKGIHARAYWSATGDCRIVARRSENASWARLVAGSNLIFPELTDSLLFSSRFVAVAGQPGVFTPKQEADREILERISVKRDGDGRPKRVRLWWADGDLETREYSEWAVAVPREIEPVEASRLITWPPEVVWGSELESALESVEMRLGKLEDLSGTFVREKRTLLLNRPARASGRFLFVPGRLLWIDEEPRPSEVLITRDGMEIHDPGNQRLERFSFGDHTLGRYVFLGFGDSLAEGLRGLDPVVFQRTATELMLQFAPVSGELTKHVKRISFTFDRRTGKLQQLGYSDPSGDSVTTTFTTIEQNTGLDPKTVSIRPPAGTKIVESKGGMPWR